MGLDSIFCYSETKEVYLFLPELELFRVENAACFSTHFDELAYSEEVVFYVIII